MRSARAFLLGFAAAASLAVPGSAAAQCAGSRVASVAGTPLLVVFPAATFAQYDGGWLVYSGPLAITITPQNSGQLWDLCAESGSALLGPLGKPIGDLEISIAGGAWQPLSQIRKVIHSDRQTRTVPAQLRLRLSWDADPPGPLAALLTFSASQP